MRVRVSLPALDTRRALVYQEHLIKPKRWRPRTSVLKASWTKNASISIILDPKIQEGNKEWRALGSITSNVHFVKATE